MGTMCENAGYLSFQPQNESMKKAAIKGQNRQFSKLLLKWNSQSNSRQMPWKGEKDPYKIWLSEIILQQTRVEQGLNYYNNFIKTFPTIQELASAPESTVFKLWEGLGYYSRCRNLIATARFICEHHHGNFPQDYESIRSLKGIGPYTAAAISSFAFNLPHAVVDGNVYRVLARVFGINEPIDSTNGKKQFNHLADELLDRDNPGIYNQAIMDFGATICKPVAPVCNDCVFKKSCVAFNENLVEELPVKQKKKSNKERWFYYFIFDYRGHTTIQQRTRKDIWQQLYQFPLLESSTELNEELIFSSAEKKGLLKKGQYNITHVSPVFRQQLSHQLIKSRFLYVVLPKKKCG